MAKKIKKEDPIKPKNSLLSFLELDKKDDARQQKEINRNKRKPTRSKVPSKRPEFTRWKRRDISEWMAYDFIGYYLNKYSEVNEEEDIDFKGRKSSDKFGRERGNVVRCLENHFDDNKEEMKKYIDFIIEWWNTEDAFVDGLPNFFSVFTDKGTFVKKYHESKKKKPKKQNRKEVDNQFSSKDAWDEYFNEDDE
jgi:hypothetical protein